MELSETEFSKQLVNFFHQWAELPKEEKVEHQESPIYEINTIQLQEFFTQYEVAQKSLNEIKESGFHANVWKVAGLKRDEVRISKVLQWFLDCRAEHGLGNQILKILLSLLPQRFQFLEPLKYRSFAESYPSSDGVNRVDIEIDAKEFLLLIEVKIDASEGFQQLQRYIDVASNKSKRRHWAVIYLTRNGQLPKAYEVSEQLISISWSKLSKKILKFTDTQDQSTHNIWLLKQFAQYIQQF